MKKAVHFGAGKIGRGFIAELLHDSGYEIVFGDVVDALVDIVNKEHQYPLFLIDHDYEEKIIDHVVAYSNIKEPEKIIDAICDAEVITTQDHCHGLRERDHGHRHPQKSDDRDRHSHC